MNVSAIIPVWNGRALLLNLLDSLHRQTLQAAEILVVDNGSNDGAAEMAEERGARVVRLGRNTGFAHAVNRGIRESKYEKLAILNSDVELHPEWLEKLSSRDAPFVAGKIFAARSPELLDGCYDLLCQGGTSWRAGNGKPDVPEFDSITPIESPSFTAGLFRKELFERVGLLDETFESYLEDADFGLRCAAKGVRGFYLPDAICHHHGSASLGRWHGDSVRRIARNQLYLVTKHYQRQWSWHIVVAQILWGLLAFRNRAGVPWLRGKWEGLRRPYRPKQPIPEPALRAILKRQEQSIRRLQIQLGMDWYWRAYFLLTREAK